LGLGSIIMDGCVIESEGMLAAGAMLTAGKRIGARELWVGRPAKHLRDLDEAALAGNKLGVEMYVKNGRAHKLANSLG
jgi:carbonic anhydrase/acetyltransferase-like protein (isoleucine patch superfamily)